jgi:hypothetical protein
MKLALSLFFAISLVTSTSAKESWLDRPEMTKAFEGKTILGKYMNGVPFTETYWFGGTISYRDSYMNDNGNWSVTAQGFCTFYDSLNGGCFLVRLQGTNCFDFFVVEDQENGPVQGGKPILVSQGWYPDKPSTCTSLSS